MDISTELAAAVVHFHEADETLRSGVGDPDANAREYLRRRRELQDTIAVAERELADAVVLEESKRLLVAVDDRERRGAATDSEGIAADLGFEPLHAVKLLQGAAEAGWVRYIRDGADESWEMTQLGREVLRPPEPDE